MVTTDLQEFCENVVALLQYLEGFIENVVPCPWGACHLTDPNTGKHTCLMTDETDCSLRPGFDRHECGKFCVKGTIIDSAETLCNLLTSDPAAFGELIASLIRVLKLTRPFMIRPCRVFVGDQVFVVEMTREECAILGGEWPQTTPGLGSPVQQGKGQGGAPDVGNDHG